jgi:MFS family permease
MITQFALPLVATVTLRASALGVGVLNAVRYAPVVVFSLLAGVWLDRHRRRPTLIAGDLACAVLIGLIPLASILGGLTLWLLCAITFLVGIPQIWFDIGCLSYLPGLVDRRHLADANGKLQITNALAAVAGPTLGGLLVGLLSAPIILTVDAASYLFSMAMLLTIRNPEPAPERDGPAASIVSSIAEGLRAVLRHRLLRSLLAQSCAFNLLFNALITVFVVYAIRSLGLNASQLGLVIGAGAAAAFAGALVAGRVRSAFGVGRTLIAATVGTCLAPLLMLVPRGASLSTILILGAAQAAYGASVVIYNITSVTLRQIITPDRLLARMNGSFRLLLFGTAPVGALGGGALGSVLGLRSTLVITTIALTTPLVAVLVSPVFRLKQLPAGPDEWGFRAAAPVRSAAPGAASGR